MTSAAIATTSPCRATAHVSRTLIAAGIPLFACTIVLGSLVWGGYVSFVLAVLAWRAAGRYA